MIIEVKVIPNSSEDRVIGEEEGILKIKCRACPEKGKANASVIALLAKQYKSPKSAIKILRGKTASRKILEIKQD